MPNASRAFPVKFEHFDISAWAGSTASPFSRHHQFSKSLHFIAFSQFNCRNDFSFLSFHLMSLCRQFSATS
eukprot:UN03141